MRSWPAGFYVCFSALLQLALSFTDTSLQGRDTSTDIQVLGQRRLSIIVLEAGNAAQIGGW